MGGVVSTTSNTTSDYNENGQVNNQKFLSLLSQLPELFSKTDCECKVNKGGKTTTIINTFFCGCRFLPSTSTRKCIFFSCLNCGNGVFYQKGLRPRDLMMIKNAIDEKNSFSIQNFIDTIKQGFYSNKVIIRILPDSEQEEEEKKLYKTIPCYSTKCQMHVELNFGNLGKHTLTLTLKTLNDFKYNEKFIKKVLFQQFIKPLYKNYKKLQKSGESKHSKILELEKKLKSLKEKSFFYEKKKCVSGFGKDNNQNNQKERPKYPREFNDLMNVKCEIITVSKQVLTYLKNLKQDLVTSKALNPEEVESLTLVLNKVSNTTVYEAEKEYEFLKDKDLDAEVLAWLQKKMETERDDKDKKADGKNNHGIDKSEIGTILKDSNLKTNQINEIMEVFDRINDWNFDVFKLNELTSGHTLFITSYTLFIKYDLLNEFSIDEKKLIVTLKEIENGYHANPYHNSMHAADVLQIMAYVITQGGLGQYITKLEVMASLVSAAIHDLDHPGLNNTFQINSGSYLATLYNDRSVLENHHCAQAFQIFRTKQHNIFVNLPKREKDEIRLTIVEMVLATDMGEHANITAKFSQLIDNDCQFQQKADIRLALDIAIKYADISNASRPPELALKWAEKIQIEFFIQGDRERELGIPISPFMDRKTPSLPALQVAFISYIIIPMFKSFCFLLPKMKFAQEYLEKNRDYWEKKDYHMKIKSKKKKKKKKSFEEKESLEIDLDEIEKEHEEGIRIRKNNNQSIENNVNENNVQENENENENDNNNNNSNSNNNNNEDF